jgi:cobalt-zinc-cadmium efflux system membrane fusion protein
MKPPSDDLSTHSSRRGPRTGGAVIEFAPGSQELESRPPRRRRRTLIIVGLAAVLIAVFLLRSTSKPALVAVPAPSVHLEGNTIRFSEEFAARHRVTSVKVAESELSPTIDVMGTVRYDVRKFAAVGARSAGRVRRVFKIMGDTVRPGEVLADIESADLGKAQAMAEALRAKELAAEINLAREQRLAEAKVTALREAETAKAEHQSLRAERRAAEKAVAALGASVDSEVGILKLRSPIAGRVISASASQGQTVEPSSTLFEVADLSTVWVELMVFERDLQRVKVGDVAEMQPAGAKSGVVKGAVARVGDFVDPSTRSAVVRVEVDNRQGLLRPGQSTSARIQSHGPAEQALVIPKASVTFVDGKPTALVLVSPGLVEPRAVELGPDDGEHVAIRKGLRAGDSVITDGLFALKSEIFR